MLDRKTYDLIKQKYSDVGSWAVWCPQIDKPKSNMGNMDWAKDEDRLCSIINPRFVLVGLNWSNHGVVEKEEGKFALPETPWMNFHSGNAHGNSFKLRFALKDTPFWGAYMTDLIKYYPKTCSGDVKEYLKKYPEVVEDNIKRFEEEVSHLGEDPVLVAMHGVAYYYLKKYLRHKYSKIVKIRHYSDRRIGKNLDGYRAEVLGVLNQCC